MNILICDDHFISAIGLESIIVKIYNTSAKIRVCHSGEEALMAFQAQRAELIIIDIGLPGISGLEVIKAIRAYNTNCKFIVMSGATDAHIFQQAIALKVNAVIRKSQSVHHLHEAIELLNSNSSTLYVDPSIEALLKGQSNLPLSGREYEVLSLMAHGLTSQEIAEKLNCSLPTVKTYRMRMMNKSGARNSSELLAWFLTKGDINRDLSSSS